MLGNITLNPMEIAMQAGQNEQTSKKLRNRIHSTWNKLTDEEIAYKTINPQKFYEAVENKYGLVRNQVESQIREWEKEFRTAA